MLGVNLELHPDDPPVPELRGIGRILTSAAAFDRVFSRCDSPVNGTTFCQGCFSTMGEDIPAAIHHFGAQKQNKIFFVHFRDVGFDGIARPDHVPTMKGENAAMPSYGVQGQLYAVGCIKGMMEAVEKS